MPRLNDSDALFFSRQLEHVIAKLYEVQYADLIARRIFPVSSEVDPGSQSVVRRHYDKVGSAKVINDYAADLPRADVLAGETTYPVKEIGTSFAYSIREIQAAAKAGVNLEQLRANAARRAIEELIETVAFSGLAECNILGLLTNTEIPEDTVADGASTTTDWASKTPDEILYDVNTAFGTMFADTNMVEKATKLLLPPLHYNMLFGTPKSSGSDMSIGRWLVANCPFLSSPADVIPCNACTGAGNEGDTTDAFFIFDPNPDKLVLEIPQDVTVHPEELRGLQYIVPVTAVVSGLHIMRPASLAKWEGI